MPLVAPVTSTVLPHILAAPFCCPWGSGPSSPATYRCNAWPSRIDSLTRFVGSLVRLIKARGRRAVPSSPGQLPLQNSTARLRPTYARLQLRPRTIVSMRKRCVRTSTTTSRRRNIQAAWAPAPASHIALALDASLSLAYVAHPPRPERAQLRNQRAAGSGSRRASRAPCLCFSSTAKSVQPSCGRPYFYREHSLVPAPIDASAVDTASIDRARRRPQPRACLPRAVAGGFSRRPNECPPSRPVCRWRARKSCPPPPRQAPPMPTRCC
eukprot:scaffold518_cov388-Prasinococcus_capsulatus_cf.AAC.30